MKPPLENLKPLIHCPVCRNEYQLAKMLVVESDGRRSTLHLTCDQCGISTLVLASFNQWGAVSLGVMTDLEAGEAKKMLESEPVSTDEVLSVHRFLKEWNGNVEEII